MGADGGGWRVDGGGGGRPCTLEWPRRVGGAERRGGYRCSSELYDERIKDRGVRSTLHSTNATDTSRLNAIALLSPPLPPSLSRAHTNTTIHTHTRTHRPSIVHPSSIHRRVGVDVHLWLLRLGVQRRDVQGGVPHVCQERSVHTVDRRDFGYTIHGIWNIAANPRANNLPEHAPSTTNSTS
jgi:hypothetical protein